MRSTSRTRSEAEDLACLVVALRAEPHRLFRASELKELTGVPKARVRGLLTDVGDVNVSRSRGTYWFQAAERPS